MTKMCLFFSIVAVLMGCHPMEAPGPENSLDSTEFTFRFGDKAQYRSSTIARRSIVLPDSTRATLNPNSEVKATGGHINFWGDGFFQGDKPFTVFAQDLYILGTGAFRLRASPKDAGESMEVLRGRFVAKKSYVSKDPETDTLGPGAMVMINRSIDLMEKETFDTSDLHTWVGGVLTLDQTHLDTMVRRIQDWFGVTIFTKGTSNELYSGSFPARRLDSVLDALGRQGFFRYTIRADTVTINF